jgi:hypothetical protein
VLLTILTHSHALGFLVTAQALFSVSSLFCPSALLTTQLHPTLGPRRPASMNFVHSTPVLCSLWLGLANGAPQQASGQCPRPLCELLQACQSHTLPTQPLSWLWQLPLPWQAIQGLHWPALPAPSPQKPGCE